MKTKIMQRLLAVFVVLCMVAVWAVPTSATGTKDFWQVDNDRVSASLNGKEPVDVAEEEKYAPTDIVRVSIVMDKAGALEAGFDAEDIANNDDAMNYRNELKKAQNAMVERINLKLGCELDVKWNLTLAANLISANVAYGQIKDIKAMDGVKTVVIETAYEPDVVEKGGDDPNMITSSMQIGSTMAYASNLTGAGSRIAIIDTGLDVDHISYDSDAFLYSLSVRAAAAGKNPDEYIKGLDLLDMAEIEAALPYLNMAAMMEGLTADDLYVNPKVPFGFNYVDTNTEITHMMDTQGEHGSHVAGIAAANAYISTREGFKNALDTVLVQGVAPDAQLMVMKVFGSNGGAYDSDYMVAIEDAVMLGADAVNLSLGSTYAGAGETTDPFYYAILNNLEKSGVVVSMSAGNDGSFADNTPYGVMYRDDTLVHTGGSPGSYTNSMAVASADNIGYSGEYMYANGGWLTPFNESDGYSNAPIGTIAGEYGYIYLNGTGTPEQFDALLELLEIESFDGYVVLCNRGDISFSEKCNAAAERGAEATIIVNTEDVGLNMDLSDYEYTAPAVAIMMFYGQLFNNPQYGATVVPGADGKAAGWTGTVEINPGPVAGLLGGYENSEMSSFSSWGVPSSLTMKPEITAPGGSIYSVAGAIKTETGYFFEDHASYETMSGTSMASPQIAGMAAVMAQYIRESGLDEATGLDERTLAQSLLMSTAVPMFDGGYGTYYPILQQGSGLANVGAAITAKSYIMMDADATASWADGKVKVELGDDPKRTGEYTFSFYINNLTDKDETYTLEADFFTQAVANAGIEDYVMHFITAELWQTTTWTVDGAESDGTALVPANGSVKVTATVKLDADEKEWLDSMYIGGAYVQGFVYAIGEATAEGEEATMHSIPVLGYYGSWTDSSMFDNGSYIEYYYGLEEQIPYLYDVNWAAGNLNSLFYSPESDPNNTYYYGGNPMIWDDTYMPERNAINSAYPITSVGYTAIRGGAAGFTYVKNVETGDMMVSQITGALGTSQIVAAFYSSSGWQLAYSEEAIPFDFAAFGEGTKLEVGVMIIPEYYVGDQGITLETIEALGDGAFFCMPMTVDNTAPTINEVAVQVMSNTLVITATDNEYVSAVALYDTYGEYLYTYTGSNADAVAGGTYDFELDLTDVGGNGFLIQVYDYAGNTATYFLDMKLGEVVDEIEEIVVTPELLPMVKGEVKSATAIVYPVNAADRSYTWTSTNEDVAIVDEDGNVLAVGVGEAELIATANADPTITASCMVQVIEINKTLNGIVWDETGSIWFSEFSIDTLPDYTKLSGDMLGTDYFVAATVGPNGTIYTSSLDTETGEGYIYTIDQETWQPQILNYCTVQGLHIFYSDLTYAPGMYGTGMLIGAYGPYVITIDPVTGAGVAIIDQYDTDIVGIASMGGGYDPGLDMYLDFMMVILSDGTVVYEEYASMPGYTSAIPLYDYLFGGRESFDSGIDMSDTWYFNSAYYDGEYLYWSAFDAANDDNVVDLYAIDIMTEMTFKVGSFADGVWPVGGLFELPCLHKNTEIRDASETSCAAPGYTGDTWCLDCGELIKEGEEIPALDHEFGEWYEVEAPKCEADGTERRDCANCDHYETRTTDAHGHSFGEWYEFKHPNCVEKGEARRDCQYCDHYESIETATNDEHIMGDWTLTTVPTCTTEGEETRVCTREGCNHTETRVVEKDPNNHDMGEWTETTAPGCETEGEEARACKREGCTHTETRKLDATGHAMGEWTETVAPGCETKGEEKRTCANCDHFETRETDATGHAMGEWAESVAPGCETKGEEKRTCANCDHFETRETDAHGHNYIESTNDKGETVHTCEHCNDSYVISVPPTGESFDLRVVMAVAVVAAAAVVVLMVYRKKFSRA